MVKVSHKHTFGSSPIKPELSDDRSMAGKTFAFPAMHRNLMDFISLLIHTEREGVEIEVMTHIHLKYSTQVSQNI